jgi:hypothetical protein
VPTTAPSTTAHDDDVRATSTTAELVRLHANPAGQVGDVTRARDSRRGPAAVGAVLVAVLACGLARRYRRATAAPTG